MAKEERKMTEEEKKDDKGEQIQNILTKSSH